MSIRKSKVFAVAAAACVLGMMLGGCGSSTSGNATEGSNVITAFDSEPQNGLIPGNTNENRRWPSYRSAVRWVGVFR